MLSRELWVRNGDEFLLQLSLRREVAESEDRSLRWLGGLSRCGRRGRGLLSKNCVGQDECERQDGGNDALQFTLQRFGVWSRMVVPGKNLIRRIHHEGRRKAPPGEGWGASIYRLITSSASSPAAPPRQCKEQ